MSNIKEAVDENAYSGLKLKPSFEPSEEIRKIFEFEKIIGT
jgi:hypothetical protein